MNSAENVLMPLEPKLLVMCERIGEALEIVYDVLYMYIPAPIGLALQSVQHTMLWHWSPLESIGKAKKYH